jgi:hypothetical protein
MAFHSDKTETTAFAAEYIGNKLDGAHFAILGK